MPYRVAFLGLSDVEREALAASLRLPRGHGPRYARVVTLTDAELLVADADHAPSVQLVLATERQAETVFIGARPPAGCARVLGRPIDALQVLRELDALATLVTHAAAPLPPPVTAATAVPAPAPAPAPALAPALAPAPAPASTPAAEAAPPAESRALVVDPSAIARLLLEQRLQAWQVAADHAANSQVALALLAQRPYDLVFLEVGLGSDSELDGLQLCRQIKQTPAWMNAWVVMASTQASELDRVRGSLAGCDAYLGKPLADADLQRLLQRQGLHRKAEARSMPG